MGLLCASQCETVASIHLGQREACSKLKKPHTWVQVIEAKFENARQAPVAIVIGDSSPQSCPIVLFFSCAVVAEFGVAMPQGLLSSLQLHCTC